MVSLSQISNKKQKITRQEVLQHISENEHDNCFKLENIVDHVEDIEIENVLLEKENAYLKYFFKQGLLL
jgi:hypothetical protein